MVNQGNALVSKGDEDIPTTTMDLTVQDQFPTTVYSGIPGKLPCTKFQGEKEAAYIQCVEIISQLSAHTVTVRISEQREDLLNFRNIGQQFLKFVMTCILHLSSAKNTKRKASYTFAKQTVTKQQLTNTERQKKIVSLCLQKRLLAQNGLNQLHANGMPHKSEKRMLENFFMNNVISFSHTLVS